MQNNFFQRYKLNVINQKTKSDIIVLDDINNYDFKVKRFFFIETKNIEKRGSHAHKKCNQIIFCLKGKIRVKLDNGKSKKIIELNKKGDGVSILPKIWSEQTYYKNTSALVLCSNKYQENDYLRVYNEFKKYISKK